MDRKMLKLYYRQIRNNLYCSKKRKKRLLDELKTNVEESLEKIRISPMENFLRYMERQKRLQIVTFESLDPEEYAEDIRRIKRKKWMLELYFFSDSFCNCIFITSYNCWLADASSELYRDN